MAYKAPELTAGNEVAHISLYGGEKFPAHECNVILPTAGKTLNFEGDVLA